MIEKKKKKRKRLVYCQYCALNPVKHEGEYCDPSCQKHDAEYQQWLEAQNGTRRR